MDSIEIPGMSLGLPLPADPREAYEKGRRDALAEFEEAREAADTPSVTPGAIEAAIGDLRHHIQSVIAKHGDKPFNSRHEVYGLLLEEVREFEEEVRNGRCIQVYSELLDIAQVAILGLASSHLWKW